MIKIAMSRAGSALLRALLDRAGAEDDRILLSEFRSTDWQSLTFTGERHLMSLRIPAPGADPVFRALTAGLEDAEFSIPGQIVADIAIGRGPELGADGSIAVTIEALTITE